MSTGNAPLPAPSRNDWLAAGAPQSVMQANLVFWARRGKMLLLNKAGFAGLVIIVAVLLLAAFAPLLAPEPINAQDLGRVLQRPSSANWLGTDDLGRDILSRLLFGARTTLYIAFVTALIVAPIGLLVGAAAGYLGGITDIVLMRLVDVFLAFPGLILALAFISALGPGLENAIIAIALASWPPIARLARAETLSIRNADYISAVRIQGASSARIIFRHILPMCIPSVVVRTTLNMSSIILTAAGMGFLGLGAQPPSPEWGAMLATGRAYMLTNGWIAAIPGLAILVTSLGFNLLGDGLRDVLDPRNG